MSGDDDRYLTDRSGEVDAFVRRLEVALAPTRARVRASGRRRRTSARLVGLGVLAAAAAAVALLVWSAQGDSGGGVGGGHGAGGSAAESIAMPSTVEGRDGAESPQPAAAVGGEAETVGAEGATPAASTR